MTLIARSVSAKLAALLNPTTGGKVRAALTVVIAVAAWSIAILGAINWDAGIVASIPALIQVVTHFTPIGNSTSPPATP